MSGMTSVALKKPNSISRTKWGDLCGKLHCLSAMFAFGRARLLGLKHGRSLTWDSVPRFESIDVKCGGSDHEP
jgi:hypothetical protein